MARSDAEADAWALPAASTPAPPQPGGAAPAAANPSDSWALPPASPTAVAIRNNLGQVIGQNPDKEAQLRRAASATGLPLPTARNLPDLALARASQASFDAEMLSRKFPSTAEILANPDYMRLAHDDVPATVAVEQHLQALAAPPAMPEPKPAPEQAQAASSAPAAYEQWLSSHGPAGTAARLLFTPEGRADVSALGAAAMEGVKGLGYAFNRLGRAAGIVTAPAPMLYDAIVGGTKAQDFHFKHLVESFDADAPAFEASPETGFGGKAFHMAGQTLGSLAQIVLSGGGGAVAEVGAAGAAVRAPGALAAPTAVAADGIGGASVAGTAARAVGEATAHGVKAMALPAVSDAVNTAQKVYETTGDAVGAAKAAMAQYAATSAGGIMPLSVAGNLLTRTASGAVAGMATGEVTRQWMNHFLPTNMQAPFSWEDLTLSGLSGMVMAGVMGPHEQMASTSPALMEMFREADRADQAARGGTVLEHLSQAAAASKLRERDPEVFREFVRRASEDGPVPAVFVDGKILADVLHQHEIGTDELGATMPEVLKQIPEALATGGAVRIPIEDFATHVAGTELQAALTPHLRTEADGMTQAEAQSFHQEQAGLMQERAAKIVQQRQADQPFIDSQAQVQDMVLKQLEATNRFTPDVNKAYAAMTRDFYTTMAGRAGMLPHELFDRHPLIINAEGRAVDALEQSGGRQYPLAPPGTRYEETSITPKMMTPDEFLARTRPLDIDESSRDNIEDLKRHIERGGELDPLHIRADGKEDGRHRAVAAKELGIQRVPVIDEQSRQQGSGLGAAFDRWFGSSKVVDESGKPLVVYHGTNQPFEAFDAAHLGSMTQASSAQGGFFFTSHAEEAGAYADLAAKRMIPGAAAHEAKTEKLMKAVEAAERTAQRTRKWDAHETLVQELEAHEFGAINAEPSGASVVPVHLAIQNPKVVTIGGTVSTGEVTKLIEEAKAAGNDGLILHDIDDSPQWGAGLHSTHYVAFDATQIKSAIGNSGAFDPSDPNILRQESKGLFTPSTNTITLLKSADLTTFLHESGHFFLDTLGKMAAEPGAPAGIRGDMETVLKAIGHEGSVEEWNAKAVDDQRDGHEQFARSFERYLMEGKAPSFELRTLFGRFRSWLVNAYKSLRSLNVELTPEVRGVFDRMLASEDAIKQAELARAYMPLFDEPGKAAMTPEEWQQYQALGGQATEEAISGLMSKTVRDMAWSDKARSKALRELGRDAAAKRRAIREEVEKEVAATPLYQAIDFLKTGMFHGEQSEVHRLDIAGLKAMYEGKAGAPDWKQLGYGSHGMLGSGGLHPDLVADQHGFASGDALVRSLVDAAPRREVVAEQTETRMLERHGEISTPEALRLAADEAVHNDVRARFLATELRALQKAVGPARELAKAAKDAAEASIDGRKVKELNDRQFLLAEARAGKEAAKRMAGGDTAGAAIAKRDQLLNNSLAKAAREAQREIEKGLGHLKRLQRDSVLGKIDLDIREQITSLLEKYDLRQTPETGPTRAQQTLAEWMGAQQAAGYAPAIPATLLDPSVRMPYRELPVGQFKGLVDSVRALEKVGRERRTVTVDGKKADLKEFIAQELLPKLAAKGERFTPGELLERPEERHTNVFAIALDHFNSWRRAVAAQLKPITFKANQYDLHELLGPFTRSIFNRVIDANYKESRMLKALSDEFAAGAEKLGRPWQDSLRETLTNTTLKDPDQAGKMLHMTRAKMLGLALHVGNESNFEKLTKGWHWDGGDVWKFLHENMTEKDWQGVQLVWDLYGKHWPDLEAMNRRLGNTMPDKIEPRAFKTKFGEQPGGYAAISYDPLRSRRGEREAMGAAIDPSQGLFGREYFRADTTTNGSMNNRIAGYNDRVDLDWHTIAPKMRETIHDLAYREALIDVNKIIEHPDFKDGFRTAYGREAHESLRDWLATLANSGTEDRQVGALGKFLRWTRTGMVVNAIAFRATTVLKHGGSAGIKTVGYFVGGGEKYYVARQARMATDYLNQVAMAREKFGEIAQRLTQQDRDYRAASANLFEPESLMAKGHRFGHAAVAWADAFTAVATAWGAYDRAIAEGLPKSQGGTGKPMTEAQAVAYANQIVREAHGSTATAARSMILNQNGEAMKMFTTLYGFMNNSYGQQLDGFDKLRTAGISNSPVLARTLMAIVMPAIWAEAIKGLPDDKKGEGWAAWFAKAIGGEVASSVPFARDAVAMVEGFPHAGQVAPESWLATMVLAGKDGVNVFRDDPTGKKKPIRDFANAVGMGLHIPGLGQAGGSVQYMADVRAGREHPQTTYEYLKGVVVGHGDHHH